MKTQTWAAISVCVVFGFGCVSESEIPIEDGILATGQSGAYALVTDGDAIYWNGSSGGVTELGLPERQLVSHATGHSFGIGLAVDGDRLYWVNGNRVMTAVKGDWEPTEIAADQPCVFSMHAADGWVYWTSYNRGTVSAWSSDLDQPIVLATNQGHPTGLALTDTHLLWTSADDGEIRWVARTGGVVEAVVSGLEGGGSLVAEESHLYWLETSGDLRRMSWTSGRTELVATGSPVFSILSTTLAVDDMYAYWVSRATATEEVGRVQRVPKDGGAPQLLDESNSYAIAVDDRGVYWSTTAGDIIALAK